jgi:TrmH family RNA methyltransferase
VSAKGDFQSTLRGDKHTLPDELRVVLVSPRNPLNIGAVARAMSNFGFTEMHLVKAYDLAFEDARSAVRSRYILERAQRHESLAAAIAGCTLVVGTTALGHRDLHVPLYRLERGARLVREHMLKSKVALLFGSEKFGLSNDDMSHCHWLMRIPTRTEHGSMNLGQASAVCLYELRRNEEAAVEPAYDLPPVAPGESLERLTTVLMEMLVESGYTQDRTAQSTEQKLRRLVRRLQVKAHDAEILLGMFRQVLWKLRNRPNSAP